MPNANDFLSSIFGIALINKGLKPTDVMPTSGKQAWWRGPCGHVWKAKVSARAKPKVSPCPYCAGRRKPARPVALG